MKIEQDKSLKLAILIDADNASADIIDALLIEIAKYGTGNVKRIYGDWSHGLNKWKEALLPHAITPIQQFAYTKGKNATDMAMVIDAMDLLYSNTFNGFCIVSSDSDFTKLASRIRESGLIVFGFGERKTPESFRQACDKFIYTENLVSDEEKTSPTSNVETATKGTAVRSPNNRKTARQLKSDTKLMNLIRNAIDEHEGEDGWANLGSIGQYLNKVNSDFDSRNYGYRNLSGLIKTIDLFETTVSNGQLLIKSKNKRG